MEDNRDIVDLESEQASLGKCLENITATKTKLREIMFQFWLNPILSCNQVNFKESFIEVVRVYPSIWDMRSSLYKDQQRKNLVWFVFF